jgi:hypothetical protein
MGTIRHMYHQGTLYILNRGHRTIILTYYRLQQPATLKVIYYINLVEICIHNMVQWDIRNWLRECISMQTITTGLTQDHKRLDLMQAPMSHLSTRSTILWIYIHVNRFRTPMMVRHPLTPVTNRITCQVGRGSLFWPESLQTLGSVSYYSIQPRKGH